MIFVDWGCNLSIMESGKLYELLLTFSPSELRQLGLILASPYFNQREDLRRLFGYFCEKLGSDEPPSREEAFAAAYPGETYDYSKLRHLLSFLYKQCEQTLIEQELKKDSFLRTTLLLRSLNGRNSEKNLRSQLNARNRLLQKTPLRNTDIHLHQIETLRLEMAGSDARTEKHQAQFQQLSGEIDVFFILHKLQLACAALTHQRMFRVKYELGMLDAVLNHIEQYGLLKVPEVSICYNCYKMLSAPDDPTSFFAMKAQMPQTRVLFEPKETRTFFTHLINFCISRINKGEGAFLREVFEIYIMALDSEVLLDDGQLSPFTYKNIVSASIKLGEYEWTARFIDEYASQLPLETGKDFHSYNLARLYLANGSYTEVVRILNRIYIKDPFTHLDGRIILIKAYYELGDYKQIEYLLENLKQILRRKEFLTYHKKNYSAFVKYARRLLNLAPFKADQHKALADEIRGAEWLSEREWLLGKIGELG